MSNNVQIIEALEEILEIEILEKYYGDEGAFLEHYKNQGNFSTLRPQFIYIREKIEKCIELAKKE